jgi:hypothetical protein
MKPGSVAVTAALALATLQASAQSAAPAPPPPPSAPLAPFTPYAAPVVFGAPPAAYRSTAMRTTGIVFTSVALAHVVAGLGMMAAAPTEPSCKCDVSHRDLFNATGIGLLGVGVGLAAIGLPLWLVGSAPRTASTGPRVALTFVAPAAPGLRLSF